jgi:hypothetical protein
MTKERHLPSSRLPLPPESPSVVSDQALCTSPVSTAKQHSYINIERRIRLGTRQELMYARQGTRNRVRGTPTRLKQVQADLAGFQVNIWMADGR